MEHTKRIVSRLKASNWRSKGRGYFGERGFRARGDNITPFSTFYRPTRKAAPCLAPSLPSKRGDLAFSKVLCAKVGEGRKTHARGVWREGAAERGVGRKCVLRGALLNVFGLRFLEPSGPCGYGNPSMLLLLASNAFWRI
jgi:hypothetical protein